MNTRRTPTITADDLLPEVLAQYPGTREVFDRYGLYGCGGTQGPREKIGWFTRLQLSSAAMIISAT